MTIVHPKEVQALRVFAWQFICPKCGDANLVPDDTDLFGQPLHCDWCMAVVKITEAVYDNGARTRKG